MSMPLVSVIMPCYNNADYVAASVNSVLDQDYPNIELIVVDDGSSDSSLQILAQFAGRIRVIQQANQGPAAARNTGMQAATGRYIAFNDSDDLWLPGKLSAQINYMEQHPHIGLCFCDWTVWDDRTPLTDILPTAESTDNHSSPALDLNRTGWLYIPLLKDSVIHTITAVIKAELIDSVGMFNTDYRIGEDHDYWLRISRQYPMAKLKRVYAVYRDNQQSTTKKVHPKNFSLLVLEASIAKYGLSCPSGAKISQSLVNDYLGRRHFTYGFHSFYAGDRHKAFNAFKHCLLLRYRPLKSLFYTMLSSNPLSYHLFLRLFK